MLNYLFNMVLELLLLSGYEFKFYYFYLFDKN